MPLLSADTSTCDTMSACDALAPAFLKQVLMKSNISFSVIPCHFSTSERVGGISESFSFEIRATFNVCVAGNLRI